MDILMPQLGETVAEGTVTSWYKKVGDAVRADEALFDVETDKVSTEIPSPVSGVLTEVLVPAGKTVKVGTRLAVVQPAARTLDASTEARGAAAAMPTSAAKSSSVVAVTAGVQRQPISAQAKAQEYETLARAQAERHATHPVAPAQAGAPGPHAYLNSRLRGNDGSSSGADALAGISASTAARDPQQKLSPVVRRLLAEHGLDPSAIPGSGRDGRITRDDVLSHVATAGRAPATLRPELRGQEAPSPLSLGEPQARQALAAAEPTHARSSPAAEHAGLREGERLFPLNNIRRRSGAAMARAWQVVPHVLQAVEADYSRIEQARRARQAAWQAREGFELTYLPFLAFAVCQALARYEQLNARIEGDNLVVLRRVQLGIAVDLNHEGLVVPVIRDAQDRNVPALAREIRRLAVGARGNKLKPDDFAQATYTISNSGVFGTLITAPIVNPPQVAILSTDGVSKRPVVVEAPEGDSIAVRPVGVLAQSFDHRAVDGAYSAAFLKELKRIVETRAWMEDVV